MLVLDSSAAIAIILHTEEGLGLQKLMETGERTIAPELYYAEVSHVLEKYVRGGHLSKQHAAKLLGEAISLVDEIQSMDNLYAEAFAESLRLRHSAYDLFYFVLARRTGATLFTFDKRLAKLAHENGLSCVYKTNINSSDWTVRVDYGDPAELLPQ